MVYRFRVTYEDHEDVFRDIEIKSAQSFMELHSAIQQSISFDNSKPAFFFASDDYWRKEEELASVNTGEPLRKTKGKSEEPQKKKILADYVNDPHQKFIYVFDPDKEWTFTVELLKIIPAEKKDYPICIKSSGTAPLQHKPSALPIPPPVEEEDAVKPAEMADDYKEPVVEVIAEDVDEDDVIISLDPDDLKAVEGVESEEETEGEEGEDPAEEEPGLEEEEP